MKRDYNHMLGINLLIINKNILCQDRKRGNIVKALLTNDISKSPHWTCFLATVTVTNVCAINYKCDFDFWIIHLTFVMR